VEGLQQLTSLDYLWLDGNQITDVSPFSGLTGLSYLLLSGNNIACADLNSLEAALGSGIVSRPSSCLP
jgi:Leucine-rich repeat (LRR) protein